MESDIHIIVPRNTLCCSVLQQAQVMMKVPTDSSLFNIYDTSREGFEQQQRILEEY